MSGFIPFTPVPSVHVRPIRPIRPCPSRPDHVRPICPVHSVRSFRPVRPRPSHQSHPSKSVHLQKVLPQDLPSGASSLAKKPFDDCELQQSDGVRLLYKKLMRRHPTVYLRTYGLTTQRLSHWLICTPSFGFQLQFNSSGANPDKRQANWHRIWHPVWHTNFHPNCHHTWNPSFDFPKCNPNCGQPNWVQRNW